MDYLVNSIEGREIVYGTGGIVDVDAGTAWETLKANHAILATGDLSVYTISTAGSTSVEKSLEAALEGFKALTGVNFVMNQTGSSDGFKRVLGEEKDSANAADIGFASRNFKAEETVADGATSGAYCLDGVAVVVEANNPYADTDAETLLSIFTGALTAWEDVE
jgi:phosphate transport system substrate-binding protein